MRKKKLKKQPIYCGQDIRNWLGYRIIAVQSNKLDRNVRIKLTNDEGHIVKLFLNGLDFDGDSIFYTEWDSEPPATPTR